MDKPQLMCDGLKIISSPDLSSGLQNWTQLSQLFLFACQWASQKQYIPKRMLYPFPQNLKLLQQPKFLTGAPRYQTQRLRIPLIRPLSDFLSTAHRLPGLWFNLLIFSQIWFFLPTVRPTFLDRVLTVSHRSYCNDFLEVFWPPVPCP